MIAITLITKTKFGRKWWHRIVVQETKKSQGTYQVERELFLPKQWGLSRRLEVRECKRIHKERITWVYASQYHDVGHALYCITNIWLWLWLWLWLWHEALGLASFYWIFNIITELSQPSYNSLLRLLPLTGIWRCGWNFHCCGVVGWWGWYILGWERKKVFRRRMA